MQHFTRASDNPSISHTVASWRGNVGRRVDRETVIRLVIGLAAIVAVLLPIRASLAQPTPNKLTGSWVSHSCVDCVRSFAVTDDTWVGTHGAGVARHSRLSGQTTRYTTDDGVGGNCVELLSASDDDHIWVATRETSPVSPHTGVSHYDGTTWTAYTTADGLPSDTVADVAAGPGGVALVAAADRIARFDGTTWHAYGTADGLPAGAALAVAIGSDGTMWAAMQNGVAKYDAGAWQPVDMSDLPAAEVDDMAAAADGSVWVTSGGKLGHHRTGGWPGSVTWRVAAPPVDAAVRVRLDLDGDAWTWGGQQSANRVLEYDGASWVTTIDFTLLTNSAGTNTPATTDFGWSPEGELWIGTYNDGLAYRRSDSWQWFVTELGPSNPVVMSVSVDYWDSPWIGLTSQFHKDNLVNRYDGWQWALYDSRVGMLRSDGSGLGIMPGAIDARGGGPFAVWLGVTGVGVARRDFGTWTTWPITDVVGSSANILGVAADGDGGAWVATNGAAHFDGSTWHRYTTADGLASDSTLSVAVDGRDDSVWIGTADAGVSHFDGTTWQTYSAADGLGSNKVQAILVDDIGSAVWFGAGPGTRGGVTRYDGITWQSFGAAEGLVGDGVWSLALAPDGAIWAAVSEGPMAGAGLARYDGFRWELYTHADGLIDNSAFDVDVTTDGVVWVATLAGVSEFAPNDDPYPYPYPGETATPTATDVSPEPSSVPPTPTKVSTPPIADTPIPTYEPPSGGATPVPGSCVCGYIRGRVPDAAINAAIANPNTVAGWGQLLDPNKPWAPYNPYRACLSMERISVPYNPLHNRLVWRVGCP